MDAQVLGISVDSKPCLKAWADSLGGISYPLLSDFWPHGKVAQLYDVLRSEGYTERAIIIIDKKGCIRYIDIHDIDKQPDNDELFAEICKIDTEAAARMAKIAPKEQVDLPHGGIVMYCTSWCPDCKRARAWLRANNLDYTEVDITTTPGASAQVKKWANGNQTTPTFDIDGTIIVDFKEDRLRDVLKERLK